MRPLSALVFLVVATCAPATRAPSINAPSSPAGPELVRSVLSDVSPARLKSDVERLAAFGTRHTRSDTTSETGGIGAARRWMKSELDAIASRPGAAQAMIVSFDREASRV